LLFLFLVACSQLSDMDFSPTLHQFPIYYTHLQLIFLSNTNAPFQVHLLLFCYVLLFHSEPRNLLLSFLCMSTLAPFKWCIGYVDITILSYTLLTSMARMAETCSGVSF
jgi:hypothetical protein